MNWTAISNSTKTKDVVIRDELGLDVAAFERILAAASQPSLQSSCFSGLPPASSLPSRQLDVSGKARRPATGATVNL